MRAYLHFLRVACWPRCVPFIDCFHLRFASISRTVSAKIAQPIAGAAMLLLCCSCKSNIDAAWFRRWYRQTTLPQTHTHTRELARSDCNKEKRLRKTAIIYFAAQPHFYQARIRLIGVVIDRTPINIMFLSINSRFPIANIVLRVCEYVNPIWKVVRSDRVSVQWQPIQTQRPRCCIAHFTCAFHQ